jgi:hypothetical protein
MNSGMEENKREKKTVNKKSLTIRTFFGLVYYSRIFNSIWKNKQINDNKT